MIGWIILYVLIACITGTAIYVFVGDSDEEYWPLALFEGLFWPVSIFLTVTVGIIYYICKNSKSIFEFFKREGFHYCKEDILPCCGQCKYMYYCNNHNEVSGCRLSKGAYRLSSDGLPCNQFKKHWLWSFRIRYKRDVK